VVQVTPQVELAHALVQKLRQGEIGGIAFEHVVGIGHSLGAALTQGVTARYVEDFDAVILTGHSAFLNGSGTGFAATAEQISNTVPDRPELRDLPNGYCTFGPIQQTLQFALYFYPHFDTESRCSFPIGQDNDHPLTMRKSSTRISALARATPSAKL
jgi:alpha-beta hydrolase superfamily lysophospholipase